MSNDVDLRPGSRQAPGGPNHGGSSPAPVEPADSGREYWPRASAAGSLRGSDHQGRGRASPADPAGTRAGGGPVVAAGRPDRAGGKRRAGGRPGGTGASRERG